MTESKQWVLMLCTALLVGGLVSALLPAGKSGTAGKTAISFFLLSCLLLPLRQISADFRPQLEYSEQRAEQWGEELQLRTEELSYSLAEDHILELVQAKLEPMNLEVLALNLNFVEDGNETQPRITITLHGKERERESEVRKLLLNEVGIWEVEFIWQEET